MAPLTYLLSAILLLTSHLHLSLANPDNMGIGAHVTAAPVLEIRQQGGGGSNFIGYSVVGSSVYSVTCSSTLSYLTNDAYWVGGCSAAGYIVPIVTACRSGTAYAAGISEACNAGLSCYTMSIYSSVSDPKPHLLMGCASIADATVYRTLAFSTGAQSTGGAVKATPTSAPSVTVPANTSPQATAASTATPAVVKSDGARGFAVPAVILFAVLAAGTLVV